MKIEKYELENGLRLIYNEDKTTSMVGMSILYNVGAKDENPDKTGFAHLFEHLMFEGSVNIPDYDGPLQKAGGENNAWTNNDMTCYYLAIPAQNIETAFWLESDRMLSLAFCEDGLEVQKNVVIEEFKQTSLNQPYGDVSHLMRELTYKVHPYRWPTIGKELSHIENVTLKDVKAFFFQHYAPNNAILSVSGPVPFPEIIRLTEKWFSGIERRNVKPRCLPQEPVQTAPRLLEVERNVPTDALYKSFHIYNRFHPDFHACDMLSDLLANGRSARLFQHLVMEKQILSEVNAYISGEIEPGTLQISAKLAKGISFQEADEAIQKELALLCEIPVEAKELEKVKNKYESNDLFANINYLNKATNMAIYELLGDADLINQEVEKYKKVTQEQIRKVARQIFKPENSNTIYYKATPLDS